MPWKSQAVEGIWYERGNLLIATKNSSKLTAWWERERVAKITGFIASNRTQEYLFHYISLQKTYLVLLFFTWRVWYCVIKEEYARTAYQILLFKRINIKQLNISTFQACHSAHWFGHGFAVFPVREGTASSDGGRSRKLTSYYYSVYLLTEQWRGIFTCTLAEGDD